MVERTAHKWVRGAKVQRIGGLPVASSLANERQHGRWGSLASQQCRKPLALTSPWSMIHSMKVNRSRGLCACMALLCEGLSCYSVFLDCILYGHRLVPDLMAECSRALCCLNALTLLYCCDAVILLCRVMSGRRSGGSSTGISDEQTNLLTSGAEKAPTCGMSAGERIMMALVAASSTQTK